MDKNTDILADILDLLGALAAVAMIEEAAAKGSDDGYKYPYAKDLTVEDAKKLIGDLLNFTEAIADDSKVPKDIRLLTGAFSAPLRDMGY